MLTKAACGIHFHIMDASFWHKRVNQSTVGEDRRALTIDWLSMARGTLRVQLRLLALLERLVCRGRVRNRYAPG